MGNRVEAVGGAPPVWPHRRPGPTFVAMGFVPVFLALGSFFFLWAGVIFHTFRRYRQQAEAASGQRAAVPAELQSLPAGALLAQGRAGTLPEGWQAEYAYRTARFRYERLRTQAPYKVFAVWFGFGPLPTA